MKKQIPLLFFLFLAQILFSQNQYAWLQKPSIPAPGRHGSLGLAIQNRGYIGLGHVASPGLVVYKDWWEYDPGNDTWMQRADFGGQGRDYACGFSIGNFAYVGTGQDTNINIHDDWWKFNPANNSWTQLGNVPGGPRDAATAFSIGNKGYLGPDIFLGDLWEYEPTTDSWTQKAFYPAGSTYVSCGTSLNGKGYVGLGLYSGFNDWWEYDPISDVWTQRMSMPGLPRSGALCFAINGFVYTGTGTDWNGENFDDMYAFNPTTNTWTPTLNFPGIPRHLLASFTIGNMAYCGTGTNGTNYNDFWQYGSLSSVNENQTSTFRTTIFPNPIISSGTISIENGTVTNGDLKIFDLNGKLIQEENNLQGNSFHIDRANLQAGIYFYEMYSNTDLVSTGKFLVK